MGLALNGTVLSGRFQVDERVGIEGRFEIYKAVEVTSRRRVLVRILDLEERSDVAIHPEIEQSAKAIMGLTHPGLLPVIDSGGHRARPYLVTPLIEAQTLDRLIAAGAFPPIAEALKLLGQISEALEQAHRAGLVHGDLSAASILVPREGRPLLLDVGVAHWADLATSRSRPQHVPPPLRAPSADLDALRRIAERLISAPLPALNQRVSMPAIPARTSATPPAVKISQPPVKTVDSTAETEVLPIVPQALTNTAAIPFIESSAVISVQTSPSAALTNVPSDTVLLPQLPGPGGSHFTRVMEEEATGPMLTPRYVVIAGLAMNRAQQLALRLFNGARRQIVGWSARSQLLAKGVALAAEGWRRFALLFEERRSKPLGEDEVDLGAAGLGGWYGWPRSRRIGIAAGGAASLLLLLIISSGPSNEASPLVVESALETETMAATQVATPASVVSEPETAPKKSNVDRLRERKKTKK